MRQGYTQNETSLTVTTVLATDELLLDTFQGSEGLSELFHFTLTMRSSNNNISADDVIGTTTTVTVKQQDGTARYFSGMVSRFVYLGSANDFALYSAELVPRMWLLTLGQDRVIYQNKSVPDIIKSVLTEYSITPKDSLTSTYSVREYCVRYDESAFAFMSRLMEDEGIFYLFSFSNGSHQLILADSTDAYAPCPNIDSLILRSAGEDYQTTDLVTHFEFGGCLVTQKHIVDDFNYMTPSTDIMASSSGEAGRGSYFEYPARYATVSEGQKKADIRVKEHQVDYQVGMAKSYCYHLAAGTTFALTENPRTALNDTYLVRRIHHQVDRGSYGNKFDLILATEEFRPPRLSPRPIVYGHHTAVVVGPSGEEIWTDVHGRIKIHFPWDRVGKKNDESSCWIRVSQAWAGQGWGALYIPRIDQEVIISYLDGDPDRPFVSGRVYNEEQTTPVSLPSKSTQSTLLSRSTKTGKAGNEMRFEDKKDAEELYLHAQKDMKTEIENDLTTTVIAGNELHTVKKGNRTLQIDTGNETHNVKGTRSLEITGNETHTNQANFTHKVTGNYELKITGNLVIEATGTIKIKGSTSVDVEAGTGLTNKAGTNLTNKAGVNLTNEAGVGLTNKGGATLTNESAVVDNKASAMQTVDGGGMLIAKGGLIKLN